MRRFEARGVALATALMLSMLLLVLGLTLLTSSQRDLYFQQQQQARDKAELLAQSGLEYCHYLVNQTPPALDSTLTLNTVYTYTVQSPTDTYQIERRMDPATGMLALVVEGLVKKTSGEVQARRTIVVPYGPDYVITEADFATQSFSKEL